jgi:chromosome partitioning protein
MRDTRSNLGKQVADEITKFFGDTVFKTSIPRNVRLAESPSYGMPVFLYDKGCSGAQAYLNLTEEILTKNGDKFKKITKKSKR